jgi:hypothetical protein
MLACTDLPPRRPRSTANGRGQRGKEVDGGNSTTAQPEQHSPQLCSPDKSRGKTSGKRGQWETKTQAREVKSARASSQTGLPNAGLHQRVVHLLNKLPSDTSLVLHC